MVCSAAVRYQFAPEIGDCHDDDIIPKTLCLHFLHKALQASVNGVKFAIDEFSIVVVRVELANCSHEAGSLQAPGWTNE